MIWTDRAQHAAKKAKPTFDWSFLNNSGNNDAHSQIKKKKSYGAKYVCLSCCQ
jgi:hypothetical protein